MPVGECHGPHEGGVGDHKRTVIQRRTGRRRRAVQRVVDRRASFRAQLHRSRTDKRPAGRRNHRSQNSRGDKRDDGFVTPTAIQSVQPQVDRLGDRVGDRQAQFAISADRHLVDRSVAVCVEHLAGGRIDPVDARFDPGEQQWVDLIDLPLSHRRQRNHSGGDMFIHFQAVDHP